MVQLERINKAFCNIGKSVEAYGFELPQIGQFSDCGQIQGRANSIPKTNLDQIAISFESYHSIISQLPTQDETIGQTNVRHLKSFLKKFGLTVDKRFFDYITDDYLIEVYSHNHQQLYRSVNFFSLSKYTLPELTFYPWEELFYRAQQDSDIMFDNIELVLKNEMSFITPDIPAHTLKEIKTKREFCYQMVKLGCVFDEFTKKAMGYLTLISVTEYSAKILSLH